MLYLSLYGLTYLMHLKILCIPKHPFAWQLAKTKIIFPHLSLSEDGSAMAHFISTIYRRRQAYICIEQYSGHPTFRGPLSPGLPLSRGGGGGGGGLVPKECPFFLFFSSEFRAGIFKQSMWARNRVGIGLSYRPARLNRLAELIPWNRFLGT